MDEAGFIAALRALPLHPGARGLSDDCAVLELGSETLILTHDAMSEGTHFFSDADPFDVAWKLVATNLSDLAAKGAEPVGVLLGYSLGQNDARFIEGFRAVLEEFKTPLLGGDTITSRASRTHGLTAIGRAAHTPVPSRSGANAGDSVYVTGTIGRAMLGYEGDAAHAQAFNRPRPMLDEGRAIAPYVTAMMDVSDGLLLDCWRMAQASQATIELDSAAIPVAAPARLDECIRWGDDYALLFTAPPGFKVPAGCTKIGTVNKRSRDPLLIDAAAPKGAPLGYQHG